MEGGIEGFLNISKTWLLGGKESTPRTPQDERCFRRVWESFRFHDLGYTVSVCGKPPFFFPLSKKKKKSTNMSSGGPLRMRLF